jgi:hypothetical protein
MRRIDDNAVVLVRVLVLLMLCKFVLEMSGIVVVVVVKTDSFFLSTTTFVVVLFVEFFCIRSTVGSIDVGVVVVVIVVVELSVLLVVADGLVVLSS